MKTIPAVFAAAMSAVSLPEGKAYNVEPVIEGRETLDGGTWHAPYNAADHFFRGIINLP